MRCWLKKFIQLKKKCSYLADKGFPRSFFLTAAVTFKSLIFYYKKNDVHLFIKNLLISTELISNIQYKFKIYCFFVYFVTKLFVQNVVNFQITDTAFIT